MPTCKTWCAVKAVDESHFEYRGDNLRHVCGAWVDLKTRTATNQDQADQIKHVTTLLGTTRFREDIEAGMVLVRERDQRQYQIETVTNKNDDSIWLEMELTDGKVPNASL